MIQTQIRQPAQQLIQRPTLPKNGIDLTGDMTVEITDEMTDEMTDEITNHAIDKALLENLDGRGKARNHTTTQTVRSRNPTMDEIIANEVFGGGENHQEEEDEVEELEEARDAEWFAAWKTTNGSM